MNASVKPSASAPYLYACLLDGREVFGVDAFPFRQDMQLLVAYSTGGRRDVVRESECRTIEVMNPEDIATLPDHRLWELANDDMDIRSAIKERCGL